MALAKKNRYINNRLHVCALYNLRVCKLMSQFRTAMARQNSNANCTNASAFRQGIIWSVAQLFLDH